MGSLAGSVGDARMTAAVRAFRDARAAGDLQQMAELALRLPSTLGFGTHPGQIPALVHQAYAAVGEPALRCRLAAALARAWVYGGDAARGQPFAAEAVDLADQLADNEVLAEALDAALLARWGPDDFTERVGLAARLADTTAHLSEVEPRLSALLWRLTTAWECLDLLAVARQLRALDVLAADSGSGRAAFFAASRRAMYALVVDELDVADQLIARARESGAATTEPDVAAVVHSLTASRARRAGDNAALRSEAAAFEEFGTAQGIASIVAESAVLWLEAGNPDRARRLLHQLASAGLEAIPHDVDYLLTLACMVDVAAATDERDLAQEGATRLQPYAGRAVLNAGAVSFHGVVDDFIYRAQGALGSADVRTWQNSAALCYQRIAATWWQEQLHTIAEVRTPGPASVIFHLRQNADHSWTVGRDTATAVLPDLKGLHYLNHLLDHPEIDVTASDLSAAANGLAGQTRPDLAAADLLDQRALAAYRQRLAEIDIGLADADAQADQQRSADLSAERAFILGEVRAATGLGGRQRRFTSTHERARVAVRKTITVALQRIDDHDPGLGRLLRDTVHTGAVCRYDPDPDRPIRWQLKTTATDI